jgi:hypothetical protein
MKPIRFFGVFLAALLLASCGQLFPTPALPELVVIPSSTATPSPPTATITAPATLTPIPTNTLLPTWTSEVTPTVSFTVPSLPISTQTVTPTKTPIPYQSRGDLHMETDCSTGENTYDEMVKMALFWNYDFIAITDHHICRDVRIACQNESRLHCFYGTQVVSENNIEILAIGIKTAIDDYLPPAEIVQLIHEQGGIAIASHPWVVPFRFSQDQLLNSGLDAMECPADGSHPFAFDTSTVPCVYDSDAASINNLDPMHTNICDMHIRTVDDLKKAISEGKCHQGTRE